MAQQTALVTMSLARVLRLSVAVCIVTLVGCYSPGDADGGGEYEYSRLTGHSYVETGMESEEVVAQRIRAGSGLGAARKRQKEAIELGELNPDETGLYGTIDPLFADREACELAIDMRSARDADALAESGRIFETTEYFDREGRPITVSQYRLNTNRLGMPTGSYLESRTRFMKIRRDERCYYVYILDGKFTGKYGWAFSGSIN